MRRNHFWKRPRIVLVMCLFISFVINLGLNQSIPTTWPGTAGTYIFLPSQVDTLNPIGHSIFNFQSRIWNSPGTVRVWCVYDDHEGFLGLRSAARGFDRLLQQPSNHSS